MFVLVWVSKGIGFSHSDVKVVLSARKDLQGTIKWLFNS